MDKVKLVVTVDAKIMRKWDRKLDEDGRNRSQDIRRYIQSAVAGWDELSAEMAPSYFTQERKERGLRKTARVRNAKAKQSATC